MKEVPKLLTFKIIIHWSFDRKSFNFLELSYPLEKLCIYFSYTQIFFITSFMMQIKKERKSSKTRD